jgi:hypothetical protein
MPYPRGRGCVPTVDFVFPYLENDFAHRPHVTRPWTDHQSPNNINRLASMVSGRPNDCPSGQSRAYGSKTGSGTDREAPQRNDCSPGSGKIVLLSTPQLTTWNHPPGKLRRSARAIGAKQLASLSRPAPSILVVVAVVSVLRLLMPIGKIRIRCRPHR